MGRGPHLVDEPGSEVASGIGFEIGIECDSQVSGGGESGRKDGWVRYDIGHHRPRCRCATPHLTGGSHNGDIGHVVSGCERVPGTIIENSAGSGPNGRSGVGHESDISPSECGVFREDIDPVGFESAVGGTDGAVPADFQVPSVDPIPRDIVVAQDKAR